MPACDCGSATKNERDLPAYVRTFVLVSAGRIGGEEMSSGGLAFEGDGLDARPDGESRRLSERKVRSFCGVTFTEETSALPGSLVLLMLMTLPSVRDRASIRRATPVGALGATRDGPLVEAVAPANENSSERSFITWGLSSVMVTDRASGLRGGVVAPETRSLEGVVERVDGLDGECV